MSTAPVPPVLSRLCRAGCGRYFKLTFATSPNAISEQTCAECLPMLLAALSATTPNEPYSAEPMRPSTTMNELVARERKRLELIAQTHLLLQLRTHRIEFEAAWRLGAGDDVLRAILERPVRP